MTTTAQNKEIVQRVEQAFQAGDLTTLGALYAPDYIDHNPFPGQPAGLDGLKQKITALRTAFPDMTLTVDLMIAEDDIVVDRWTSTATHRGEFMGVPATGARTRVTGISIYRIANGKVVEEWTEFDGLGLLEQLGVLSAQ